LTIFVSVRVRMRQQDDEDNIIKNGGAWCSFSNDLYQYFEKSSEGTLFASCQQQVNVSKVLYTVSLHRTYTRALTLENVGQAIMEFLINERDPRAMGPQCIQRESCLPGTSSQKSSIY
jgi:hypothetical protein